MQLTPKGYLRFSVFLANGPIKTLKANYKNKTRLIVASPMKWLLFGFLFALLLASLGVSLAYGENSQKPQVIVLSALANDLQGSITVPGIFHQGDTPFFSWPNQMENDKVVYYGGQLDCFVSNIDRTQLNQPGIADDVKLEMVFDIETKKISGVITGKAVSILAYDTLMEKGEYLILPLNSYGSGPKNVTCESTFQGVISGELTLAYGDTYNIKGISKISATCKATIITSSGSDYQNQLFPLVQTKSFTKDMNITGQIGYTSGNIQSSIWIQNQNFLNDPDTFKFIIMADWGSPCSIAEVTKWYVDTPIETSSTPAGPSVTTPTNSPISQPTQNAQPSQHDQATPASSNNTSNSLFERLSQWGNGFGGIAIVGTSILITGGLAVSLRHFMRSRRSGMEPPMELAEMFPENPDEGIMVASDDEGLIEWLWRMHQQYGNVKVATPENLPKPVAGNEEESFWDIVSKYWAVEKTDEQRAAEDIANEVAGRKMNEAAVWGSGSRIDEALDPDDKARILRQVEAERVADAGQVWVKGVRAAEKTRTLIGTGGDVPDSHYEIPGGSLVDRARQIGDGAGRIKNYSGAIDSAYDVAVPDAHDIADMAGFKYTKNESAHRAYDVFIERYGRIPSPDNSSDVETWSDIMERVKSGEVK